MTSHESTKMDLDRIQYQSSEAYDEEWSNSNVGNWADASEVVEELHAFSGTCFTCGGFGHSANQCPTKKGNKGGQGKSSQGKGYGKENPKGSHPFLKIRWDLDSFN